MASDPALEKEIQLLKRQLSREREGRIRAEELLESKSRTLYEVNVQLSNTLSALKSHEKQLIQQEKLASIGQLAAGVAHEINTPAGFAMCNLDVLKQYVQTWLCFKQSLMSLSGECKEQVQLLESKFGMAEIEDDMPELISETMIGLERIAAIVRELRAFARHGDDEKTWVNIDLLLRDTLNLAAGQIKYHVEVICDLNCTTEVLCIASKLSQVFLNIIVNAGQAIKQKGHLWITSYQQDESVVIHFKDDGAGMDELTQSKIFDAFFTTKPIGQGTGLGLSISMDIINQHHGQLSVVSKLGHGTEFIIELPINYKNREEGV